MATTAWATPTCTGGEIESASNVVRKSTATEPIIRFFKTPFTGLQVRFLHGAFHLTMAEVVNADIALRT